MTKKTEWFQNWFDTKYYHLLYDHRNDDEAEFFMKNLIEFLNLKKGDKILDLPCGKGRHSVFLNSIGFDITGSDLSKNSIEFAKKHENNSLKFSLHDMRKPLRGQYDAIFNLFTSFGYFEHEQSNIDVLVNFKNALINNGSVVIDFLNVKKAKQNLIPEEKFEKNGIQFHIRKYIENNFLIKDIRFKTGDIDHHYTEKVQYLTLENMTDFMSAANLKIKTVFGDYALNSFDENKSDRLILILQ